MSAFVQYTVQGLAAGGFYALAALGLAVIFGVLGVVNFSHGACYMLGAVAAAVLLDVLEVHFWLALAIVPVLLFLVGVTMERLLIRWLLRLDPLYNFLLTFGLSLILVDVVKRRYGVSGLPYERPAGLDGQLHLGGITLPTYSVFVFLLSLLVCVLVWVLLTKTRVGMIVRASTEDADRSRALGINVGRWVTPVFGFGIALAGLAGVMAAPRISARSSPASWWAWSRPTARRTPRPSPR
jgi:branched-chain amino acid transport system permease protein